MNFIGIDPGLHGAVAVVGMDGQFLRVHDTPSVQVTSQGRTRGEFDVARMLSVLGACKIGPTNRMEVEPWIVALEDPRTAIPFGGRTSGAAIYSIGRGVGLWEMAIASLNMPYQKIRPQEWKQAMVGTKTADQKHLSLVVARRLWPAADLSLAKHDGRAEALLIAEFYRRQWSGGRT